MFRNMLVLSVNKAYFYPFFPGNHSANDFLELAMNLVSHSSQLAMATLSVFPLRRHQSDEDDDVEPNDGHDDGGFRCIPGSGELGQLGSPI